MTPSILPQPAEFDEALYAEAEQYQAQSAADLVGMACLAYEHRQDRAAIRQLSFQWARDARRMAAAVNRWSDWFIASNGMPAMITEVDEAITLFALAALPEDEATPLLHAWREHSYRSWQVKDMIERAKAAKAESAGQVKRLKARAVVREIGPHLVLLTLDGADALPGEAEREWAGRRVKVTLVLEEA